jgi:hypothetical protein
LSSTVFAAPPGHRQPQQDDQVTDVGRAKFDVLRKRILVAA